MLRNVVVRFFINLLLKSIKNHPLLRSGLFSTIFFLFFDPKDTAQGIIPCYCISIHLLIVYRILSKLCTAIFVYGVRLITQRTVLLAHINLTFAKHLECQDIERDVFKSICNIRTRIRSFSFADIMYNVFVSKMYF